MNDVVLRLLLLVLIAGGGWFVYQMIVRANLARAASLVQRDPLLEQARPGVPTIVYFTTPHCIPCKTQQQPALRRLEDRLGAQVQIIQIDATRDPEAAQRWGVMTAPTTFVLNSQGQPAAVNYGVADEDKLIRQIEAASA